LASKIIPLTIRLENVEGFGIQQIDPVGLQDFDGLIIVAEAKNHHRLALGKSDKGFVLISSDPPSSSRFNSRFIVAVELKKN